MVEHELTERAVQARHLPPHEGEPRARNGNTGFKVEAKGGADIRMVAGFEIKIPWFAPPGNFHILGLICAIGGVSRWQIG